MTRPKAVTMWALAIKNSAGVVFLERVYPVFGRTKAIVISHAVYEAGEDWDDLVHRRGYRVVKVRVEVV